MSPSFDAQILSFAEEQRAHFDNKRGNIFGLVCGEVAHYSRTLQLILPRYLALNEQYLALHDRMMASLEPGESGRSLTEEEMALRREQSDIGFQLRHEVELFYLFSRILLDKITQATVAFFGPGPGEQTSHRRFTGSITEYCKKKCVEVSPEITKTMETLQAEIVDFRDDVVVHAKSPRGLRGFGWNNERRRVYLMYTRLYPQASDTQIDGQTPVLLMDEIERYGALWLSLLKSGA